MGNYCQLDTDSIISGIQTRRHFCLTYYFNLLWVIFLSAANKTDILQQCLPNAHHDNESYQDHNSSSNCDEQNTTNQHQVREDASLTAEPSLQQQ